MEITNQLVEEHVEVIKMLQMIKNIALSLEQGKELNIKEFSGILDFLHVFVDHRHHRKEEKALFPALEQSGISNEGGLIGQMLAEHQQGRNLIRGLKEAYEVYRSDNRASKIKIIRNGREYASLMEKHIEKENTILFPLAERILPDESKVIIRLKFNNIDLAKS